ncbi:MAG TPA: SPOR domain-containing protein [Candidimonas sp.]|nr:SPOR domain-containing protein [Candidimonas sp.]
MGLFSRNESAAGSGRRSTPRSSMSSEAQASDLRGRARRRLIGALALVLAAVIVVPMLFDSSPPADQTSAPVVIPAIVPPATDSGPSAAAPSQPADSGAISAAPQGEPSQGNLHAPNPSVQVQPDPNKQASAVPPSDTLTPVESSPPESKPADKPAPKPEPKAADGRTDDGSVAMALLEGRSPAKAVPTPAAKGSFVLQIAAYTTDKDAQTRRDRLVAAGVTNAYVENASSGGKTTYRLRVGPFPTRDAAQAAQARLRALGYDNGFISAK